MYALLKRGFDVLAALAGLGLLSPVLLLTALLIYTREGPPIFYRERRLGRREQPFALIKFRSLRPGSPAAPHLAADGDPRITPLGQSLRRWRIDEFPTLINVLLGHMSLVGPRPLVAEHAQHLTPEQRLRIYSVRPGLTDPAAVHFLADDAALAGSSDAEAVYFARIFHAKIAISVAAIEQASFRQDLQVLFMTARQLWSRQARQESEHAMRALLETPGESTSNGTQDIPHRERDVD